MELIKYRDKDTGRILIKPKNKADLPMFTHCSGGLIAVTQKFLEQELEPLLFAHGEHSIGVENIT